MDQRGNVHRLVDYAINGPTERIASYFQHTIAELEQRLAELGSAEHALRSSEARYRALYDNNPAMYFTVDADGVVLSVNEFGALQLGYQSDELIGKPVLDVFLELDRPHVSRALAECLNRPGQPRSWEFRKRRKDGSVLWVRETIRAIREPDGRPVLLIVCEDASALKSSEARIRDTTDRLDLALKNSNLAIFSWEIDTGTVYLSDRWNEILGGAPGDMLTTCQALNALVHPDDVDAYRDQLYAAVRGESAEFRFEHRVRTHDGQWRWISSQGKVVERDASGHALRMVGTYADITARKLAEDEARRHAGEFEALYDETRELARYRDLSGLSQSVVDCALRLLGTTAGGIWLHDALRGDLVLSVARNLPLPQGARVAPGKGLAGRVALTREPVIVDDYRNWPHRLTDASDKTVHAALAVPLISRGELIGVLKVCENQSSTRRYSDNDARLLTLLAGPAATAIERIRAEDDLRQSEARFRKLTELSSDWYWEQDDCFRFTLVSGGMLEQAGFPAAAHMGLSCWELPGVEFCEPGWAEHRATLQRFTPFRDVVYMRKNDAGEMFYHSISGEPIFDAGARFCGYRGVGCDVTERVKAEQRIHHLAHYDSLSGLPNRALFAERLQQALQRSARSGSSLALLVMDIDRFKNINDSFGHQAGDRLLQEAAQRLSAAVCENDLVARLGGDEFVVLVESFSAIGELSTLARNLLDAIARPFLIDGQECHLSASIGISSYPDDSKDVQSLLRDADTAMYRAKDKGKDTFEFYSAQMNRHAFARLAMETDMHRGLERNEFLLHYQPKVDLASGRIAGMEALVRWRRPDGSLMGPCEFIPLAEECGVIQQLGAWVLREACAQARIWRSEGLPALPIAVNLSARQFLHEDLLDTVAQIVEQTGIDPALLELEITESLMLRNPEQASSVLQALKQMGVRLALDDFGTGYSNLSYLKRFPFDCLKIDRSFIQDVPTDEEDAAITRAMIAMAHGLRLQVVAEGAESAEQIAFLRAHACDAVQGNFFSPPLSAAAFSALLRAELITAQTGSGLAQQEAKTIG